MNVSLASMGMLRTITMSEQGDAFIGLVFPCIGCPAWQLIQDEVRERVERLEGVRRVRVKVLWDAPWKKEDIPREVRERIRSHGYQIDPLDAGVARTPGLSPAPVFEIHPLP